MPNRISVEQLELDIIGATNQQSVLADVFDRLPLYVYRQSKDKFIRKSFLLGEDPCEVNIFPASVLSSKGVTYRYAGGTEDLVEAGLRYLAANNPYVEDGKNVGVAFGRNAILELLKDYGHEISYRKLVSSLEVLTKSHLEVTFYSAGKALTFSGSYLTGLVQYSENAFGRNARLWASFHPLVSRQLLTNKFYSHNISDYMTLKSPLERELYKKLIYHRGLSVESPYRISLTSFLESSMMKRRKAISENLTLIQKALTSMGNQGIIKDFRCGLRKNQTRDWNIVIVPGEGLVKSIKRGNLNRSRLAMKDAKRLVGSS